MKPGQYTGHTASFNLTVNTTAEGFVAIGIDPIGVMIALPPEDAKRFAHAILRAASGEVDQQH